MLRSLKIDRGLYPRMILGSIGAACLGAIQPCWGISMGQLINTLYDQQNEDTLLAICIGFVILGFLSLFCGWLGYSNWGIVGMLIGKKMRETAFSSLIKQEISFFDQTNSGSLVNSLASDVSLVENLISDRGAQFVQAFAECWIALGVGLFFGWEMMSTLIPVVPLIMATSLINVLMIKKLTIAHSAAFQSAVSVANEMLSSLRTVYSFGRQNYFIQSFQNQLLSYTDKNFRSRMVAFAWSNGRASFRFMNALCFWWGGTLVSRGEMKVGDMLIVYYSVVQVGSSLNRFLDSVSEYVKSQVAALKVWEMIDRPTNFQEGKQVLPENYTPILKFEGVSFSYPLRPDVPVLSDISFELHPGQTVAIIGRSGSGKSTIISLIERFYDPSSGRISIDDIPIDDLRVQWLRSQIALVSQEPVLFALSIRENIRFGRLQANEDEIVEAAQAAHAHDFISHLPDGYDTEVGERGLQLSGGQKQRVAIARAILKNPAFLLLDEATSALDSESEKLVQDALEKMMKTCTTLVVAHRLSTIRNAASILVMRDGKIEEQGNHQELVEFGGIYANLVAPRKDLPPN